jgi:hypothetical protein
MSSTAFLRFTLPALALFIAACANYSSAKKTRLTYEPVSPAGLIIASTLTRHAESPEGQIGAYLDAVDKAATVLKRNPGDVQARKDYNFAISRIMEVVNDAGLDPGKKAIRCPGARRNWVFAVKTPDKPIDQDLSMYRITPADRYEFEGRLVKERSVKAGLGAPLVATNKGFDPVSVDRFAQGRFMYYGITAVMDCRGNSCEARLLDPLSAEYVTLDGNTYPLAADFTAPIGLALAELKPRKLELQRLFKPEEFRDSTRLARLQPYDPNKIPLLLVHGLGDSQATWAPMVEALRSDATIRKNYQIWFYSYPTGYPYPFTAAILREQMDAITARYPGHKKIVLIGHSMGGMIARTLITDSGLKIWNSIFDTPPGRTPLSDEASQLVEKALIFKHRTDIARVIFCSASLGGSDLATGFMGKFGAKLIGRPSDLKEAGREFVMLAKPREDGVTLKQLPNSVELLDPKNRFINAVNAIPVARGIPYHSIMGDRGKGGNLNHTKPQSSDGIVPYWSSHIDGAESELIVPSNHWSNQHPMAIAEVRRILMQHLRESSK